MVPQKEETMAEGAPSALPPRQGSTDGSGLADQYVDGAAGGKMWPTEGIETYDIDMDDSTVDASVWIHIYHTDPYTAWLNWAGLKYAEIPIYHAGVEVYGNEWAYQYFDDTWNDPTVSGVICCRPKKMMGFDYQESVCLGPTQLSVSEVGRVLLDLESKWPACSYHLTRHNCLTFAHEFVNILKPPKPFPECLLGFGDAPKYIPITEAVIDYGWSWYKWGMTRNLQTEEQQQQPLQEANGRPVQGCFW